MNALFRRQVYIRLTDDQSALVCTVKYGRFYSKVTEFAMNHEPIRGAANEHNLLLLRKRRAIQEIRDQ